MKSVAEKIMVFISYARIDLAQAKNVYRQLENAGFSPWMDVEDILPGEDWRRSISFAIKKSDFFLILLSKNSTGPNSGVQAELGYALNQWGNLVEGNIYFIPVRLDDCKVPKSLARFQWVDLFEPDGFSRILKVLNTGVEHINLTREHYAILKRGAIIWNQWRKDNPSIEPNLFNKDISDMELKGIDLSKANLNKTVLVGVDFTGACLVDSSCRVADFRQANLANADLENADLTAAILIETNFRNANLSNCKIYGVSAWDVNLSNAQQKNLVLSREGEPRITVDNIEVAQFVYLLLRNEKIRSIIDTITSKVVLILGRFTPERKLVLDALREELRKHDFLPILFDFEVPSKRNLTETISTLAHMARFVIADITDAKSIPQELQRIIPDLPSLPIQPLIQSSQYEYAMFKDFLDYQTVLLPYRYNNIRELLNEIEEKVINPAITKADEIEKRRRDVDLLMKR